jgi:outer membrane immunogenic protein
MATGQHRPEICGSNSRTPIDCYLLTAISSLRGIPKSPNDPVAAIIFSGAVIGDSGAVTNFKVPQSGPVGGFEAGYNWQWGANWLLGLEADFSFAGMRGTTSGTSAPSFAGFSQTVTAQQSAAWYGTVRGRLGWLATPNLLVFGTGGFAYGRVNDSANWEFNPAGPGSLVVTNAVFSVSVLCTGGIPCFAGSSSEIRTGWTAGGGAEWLLDQHWRAKIEYQFVDLGSETVRIIGTPCPPTTCQPPTSTASFNAIFHDRFNVVRVGLNYRF